MDGLSKCSRFVVGFDESINKFSQHQQMDIAVRYWDEEMHAAQSRYVGSVFLTSTKAIDLLNGIKDCFKSHPTLISKVIQISMDGPHVNLKLFRDLDQEMQSIDGNGNGHSLLNIGSCGLHSIHNAFRNGIKQAGWEMDCFFISLQKLFKDYPLRRAEYSSTTQSDIFPLKFCATRWVENGKVAERAKQMLPHLRKYVSAVQQQSRTKMKESNTAYMRSFATVEKSKPFTIVADTIADLLFEAKLSFFCAAAGAVEPFLREFQSESPMVPFLYEELSSLVRGVAEKVLNAETLSRSKSLCELDLSEKNQLPAEKVDIGIAPKVQLKQSIKQHNIAEHKVFEFRQQCRSYYIGFLKKERSPLNYSLTRSLSSLDPTTMARSSKIAAQRLDTCLEKFVETSNLTGLEADKIKQEYNQLLGISHIKEMLQEYRRSEERLDTYWFKMISNAGRAMDNLSGFVRIVMIMSHGNAGLERGFSINDECLIKNMKEDSLVAQRVVHDTVQSSGGVLKVDITKSLIQYARNASSRYKEALETRKKQSAAEIEESSRKREAADKIKLLEAKKRQMLCDAEKQAADLDSQIRQLKG